MAIKTQNVDVVSVGDLLADQNLRIPAYQRPYSWTPDTALQLLDDFRHAHATSPERSYVLGAVILHQHGSVRDVVDGQQRLLTLTMLRQLLTATSTDGGPRVGEDPQSAVVQVRAALARRVGTLGAQREGLAAYLDTHCQLIRVETDDVDEAFRVFDSQNYRGKALLPHDLLKAFHLRAMRHESDAMQAAVVEGWEQVPDTELDRLFSTYLYRILRWSRGEPARSFNTQDLHMFQGVGARDLQTPSARYHLAAQAAVQMLSSWSGDLPGAHGQPDAERRAASRARFQIDAPIVAGRTFFEMVSFMLVELKELRRESFIDWEQFASTDDGLIEQPARSRLRYVSELYLAAMLYYTNKFADADVDVARQRLFTWAYGLRVRQSRVLFVSVDNLARGRGGISAFQVLRNASSPSDLRRLPTGPDVDPGQTSDADLVALLASLEG